MELSKFDHSKPVEISMTVPEEIKNKYKETFRSVVRNFFPQEFLLSIKITEITKNNQTTIKYKYKPLI